MRGSRKGPRRRPDAGARKGSRHKPPPDTRWVYGRHVVEETLSSKKCRVQSVWILDADRGKAEDIEKRAHKTGARVSWVPKKELDRITGGGAHQGLAAKIVDRPGAGLTAFLAELSPTAKEGMVLVALDQIQDPHNFGAVARSAVCLGASALIHPERRSAPLTQAVLASSAGAIQKIATFSVVNLAQTLELLKKEGFWIYGAEGSGRAVWDVKLHRPCVLVIGSEGKGLRPLVRRYCDELVAVPQSKDGVSSLNASCAASVLLYETARQAAKK